LGGDAHFNARNYVNLERPLWIITSRRVYNQATGWIRPEVVVEVTIAPHVHIFLLPASLRLLRYCLESDLRNARWLFLDLLYPYIIDPQGARPRDS